MDNFNQETIIEKPTYQAVGPLIFQRQFEIRDGRKKPLARKPLRYCISQESLDLVRTKAAWGSE